MIVDPLWPAWQLQKEEGACKAGLPGRQLQQQPGRAGATCLLLLLVYRC
jgi:hypothetical protein